MRLKFEGSQPCAGCKTTGTERPRTAKDDLCEECKQNLVIGRELRKDYREKDYAYVSTTWYKLEFYNRDKGGEEISSAFYRLFDLMHRKGLDWSERIYLTKQEATTAHNTYIMKKDVALAFKKLIEALEGQQQRYRDAMKNIENEKEKVIKKERNRLYNEGVKYGRSLLVQLNKGEITLADLEKEIIKF